MNIGNPTLADGYSDYAVKLAVELQNRGNWESTVTLSNKDADTSHPSALATGARCGMSVKDGRYQTIGNMLASIHNRVMYADDRKLSAWRETMLDNIDDHGNDIFLIIGEVLQDIDAKLMNAHLNENIEAKNAIIQSEIKRVKNDKTQSPEDIEYMVKRYREFLVKLYPTITLKVRLNGEAQRVPYPLTCDSIGGVLKNEDVARAFYYYVFMRVSVRMLKLLIQRYTTAGTQYEYEKMKKHEAPVTIVSLYAKADEESDRLDSTIAGHIEDLSSRLDMERIELIESLNGVLTARQMAYVRKLISGEDYKRSGKMNATVRERLYSMKEDIYSRLYRYA